MKLSLVATLYQSAAHIKEFYEEASVAAKKLVGEDYEIVLVNDGSLDDSLEMAIKITQQDTHVVLIDLSRNFGHHKAMMTGLAHTKGEYIFLIDSDLEENPLWLLSFADQMKSEDCDVVYGIQGRRKGNWLERWSGSCFYYLFNALSGLSLPENITTARLMTRRYVDALLSHEEREVFIAGLLLITGFDQRGQVITKRSSSKSTYTLRRKVSLLVNSVTSFSNAPLVSIFYIGLSISLLSLVYIAFLLFYWLFLAKPMSGWTSVMASIWLIGGLILSGMGIIGIYLSKVFSESKRRPNTIIREIYGRR